VFDFFFSLFCLFLFFFCLPSFEVILCLILWHFVSVFCTSFVPSCGHFCAGFLHLVTSFQLCSSLVATCGQRLHIFVASFVQFCVLVSHLLSSLCASSHRFVSSFLRAESRALENLVSSW
jgi:hypothetical protein